MVSATVGFGFFGRSDTTQCNHTREAVIFYVPRDTAHGRGFHLWPPKCWHIGSWHLSGTQRCAKRNICYLTTFSSCAHSSAKSCKHLSFPNDWKALIAILKIGDGCCSSFRGVFRKIILGLSEVGAYQSFFYRVRQVWNVYCTQSIFREAGGSSFDNCWISTSLKCSLNCLVVLLRIIIKLRFTLPVKKKVFIA